jgi:hypothetical protein
MAAPFLDTNSKIEEAIKAVVDDLALSNITVNTSIDDDELAIPYIICSVSTSGEEETIGSGYFRFNAEIKIATSSDDSDLATHRTRVATVRDEFFDSDIAATLTGKVSDLFIPFGGVLKMGMGPEEVINKKLISTLMLDIIACGATVTA